MEHPTPVTLEWKNLHYSVKTRKGEKEILRGVSGFAQPGTLTAILGASGAGKTSLLSILAGRLGYQAGAALSGELLANGADVDATSQCAYVMQEPALFAFASASETCEFASRLRHPREVPLEDKQKAALETLKALGLGRVLDTRVGGKFVQGLSGGERQRVGIACEMIAAPGLVLCDEPTSGLDSTQAFRVMKSLSELAKSGRTVIVSIHQPRSAIFSLFDQVVLMASGRTAYFGPATNMVGFFKQAGHECPMHFNPADFALDITSVDGCVGGQGDEADAAQAKAQAMALCDRAAADCEHALALKPGAGAAGAVQRGPRASWCEQFSVLLKRSWREATRNRLGNFIKLFQACLTALIVVALYSDMGQDLKQPKAVQDRTGLLFFLVISGLFGPLFGTIQVFSPEVGIVNRERAGNLYHVTAYYLSKLVVALPFDAVPLLISGSIIYWLLGLNHSFERFLIFCAFYVLMNLCSIGIAFLLSAVANGRAEVASGMVAPVAIILLFAGGFYLNVESIPVWIRWVSKISYLTFSYEGLVVNEFKTLPGGEAVISQLGFSEDAVQVNLTWLVVIALAHHTAAVLVMTLKGPKYQPMEKPRAPAAADRSDAPMLQP